MTENEFTASPDIFATEMNQGENLSNSLNLLLSQIMSSKSPTKKNLTIAVRENILTSSKSLTGYSVKL